MIVRDEGHVIDRCLDSVRPLITQWAIVDTGSSDDTPARIEAALGDLSGELFHRPWVDFGHNRSEALSLAANQGDWLLLIDADEELVIEPGFRLPADDGVEAWQILQKPGGSFEFYLPRLLRSDHPWQFEGVLHEHLDSPRHYRRKILPGLAQTGHFDSARNQRPLPEKYLDDAATLEKALEAEPNHARYWFYLGQSLRDAGESRRAIDAYRQRERMGGWDEERYCSMFEVARGLEQIGAPRGEVVAAYLTAWNLRPQRAEPLVELARLHRDSGEHSVALLFAREAASLQRPEDILYVDASAYAWRARDELALAHFWTGNGAKARRIAEQLLASGNLPESELARVRDNLEWFRNAARGRA